ncbi:FAD-dependent oxidoreductase [Leptothoe spongobia]|uniref:FAD-dependent monooxygenase n=1 Tax=Leptothoe spongobia TAU-MAC 1115 TaxID=1967444 RepID=A0A947GIY6_9CYAN|nr:NAD(P)/FAD-dependent oxidoreductase [Leptothoe spongobia]MBT9316074.1 FAD-dependent monooxygenase [Leptothoe spongobia TAU-MAC 1115]
MDTDNLYDVLIVGAGPVGLATAIALYQRGITNILVIDQTHGFGKVGQTVDILPNGLKALHCIDKQAYNQIKAIGLGFIQDRRQKSEGKDQTKPRQRFWYQKDLQGNVIRTIPLDFDYWLNHYGEGRVSIPWHSLQTNLRKQLPANIVKPNHRCVDLTHKPTSVVVDTLSDDQTVENPFAHWQRKASTPLAENEPAKQGFSHQQFTAKLVVAADGINSTVRDVIYQDAGLSQWSKPQYSGYAAIGCLQIDHISDQVIQELDHQFLKSQSVVTLRNSPVNSARQPMDSPRLMLLRRDKNSLGYLLHLPVSLDLLNHSSPEAVVELAANRLKDNGFPNTLSQVVRLSNLNQLICRPYYIHPANIDHPQPIWSRGRVVLVGDAAHGMPPFAAQGANQGLEDAAVIGIAIANIITNHHLDNQAIISRQFRKYEQLRRPFMAKIQDATLHNHNWSQEEWTQYSDMVYSRNLADVI